MLKKLHLEYFLNLVANDNQNLLGLMLFYLFSKIALEINTCKARLIWRLRSQGSLSAVPI